MAGTAERQTPLTMHDSDRPSWQGVREQPDPEVLRAFDRNFRLACKFAGWLLGFLVGWFLWGVFRGNVWLALPCLGLVPFAIARWMHLQVDLSVIVPRRSSSAQLVLNGASWICLIAPLTLPVACVISVPRGFAQGTHTPIASAANFYPFIYVQLAAVLFGVLSLATVRRWEPTGILARSLIGVVLGCASLAFMLAGAAVVSLRF